MDIGRLNSKLNNIKGVLDFSSLEKKISDAGETLNSLKQTTLAINKVGKSINGIKSLNQALPEVKESIANLEAVAPIVELTNKMPGLEDKMNKALTDAEKVLVQQMTGSPWTNPDTGVVGIPKGQDANQIIGVKRANKLVGTPESIQSNINKITGEIPDFNKIMKGIVPPEFEASAKAGLAKIASLENAVNNFGANITSKLNAIKNIPDGLKDLTDGLGGLAGGVLNGDLNKAIKSTNFSLNALAKVDADLSSLGMLQNIKLSEVDHIEAGINTIAGKVLDPIAKLKAIKDIKLGKYNTVINTISSAAAKINNIATASVAENIQETLGLTTTDLETKINKLTTDIATNVVVDEVSTTSGSTGKVTNIGSTSNQWEGANTVISTDKTASTTSVDFKFSRVSNEEELVADFNSIQREITEMIVHWSGHFLDQPHAGAEEIHKKNIALNLDGCAYHYVITKKGHIERGRPAEQPGQHCEGHDKFSLGVCLIGGVNSYTHEPEDDWEYGKENFTTFQMESLKKILNAYYKIWPGGSAFGHNDIHEWAQDPGFDVARFVKTNFNKTNQTNPSEDALDQAALVAESVMLTNATTEYNKPIAPLVAPIAKFPQVAEAVQDNVGAIIAGKIPISVSGYDEAVHLFNQGKLKAGDIIKSVNNLTDDVFTVTRDDQKFEELKNSLPANITIADIELLQKGKDNIGLVDLRGLTGEELKQLAIGEIELRSLQLEQEVQDAVGFVDVVTKAVDESGL